ncbi:MAG TPA: hypothetical protein V6C84_28885 [Coleofasciculaceae cyanobacterium]
MSQTRHPVKYFFLSDGWSVGRVWEFGGLWNEASWRRKPEIHQTHLCLWENGEKLWLYRVEEAVLMVEVKPIANAASAATRTIGQVVLKRLISGDQAIDLLSKAEMSVSIGDGEPSIGEATGR